MWKTRIAWAPVLALASLAGSAGAASTLLLLKMFAEYPSSTHARKGQGLLGPQLVQSEENLAATEGSRDRRRQGRPQNLEVLREDCAESAADQDVSAAGSGDILDIEIDRLQPPLRASAHCAAYPE